MKKWIAALLTVLVITLLVACGDKEQLANEAEAEATETKETSTGSSAETAFPMTLNHELGETVLEEKPETVVVFDFGILDALSKLDVEVAGVPQAAIPPYLEEYAGSEYTNVGSLKEPDFEAIHAMQPDLIIISARQADLYPEFEEIAPTVYMGLDTLDYMNSFETNMTLLGELFGKEQEMATELQAVKEEVATIAKDLESVEGKTSFVMVNEGKVSAFGPGSRFGTVFDVFGYNAADENLEVSTHGQSVSFEYLAETNPDILFVLDRSMAFEEGAYANTDFENELVQKTNAYKNGKIIYVDPSAWYLAGGGLDSMRIMIEDMKKGM
ncbi:siderophore ABC transporter substrate-binding protein [Chryseomicrobium excrementi]|uniref:siderophore ABC transporter substrate-binding protein n=1 Tax=Chryseomicrobium excrementi TaxID=2041346 RepID=UPI00157C30B6|nr:siderophore ABC transporter substrate-binding protein [Chryseomicrobium excrementi]